MTIRAVLRNGHIEPTEPLPPSWGDGQELIVEEPASPATDQELDDWGRELDTATSQILPADHERFHQALDEIEKESKDAVRREWGLP
jgi:hypothetical protein